MLLERAIGDARIRGNGAGCPTGEIRGEKRSNETQQSKTDPLSRLFRKARGHEAKASDMGHVLTENRNDLAVGAVPTMASGYAEREAALRS